LGGQYVKSVDQYKYLEIVLDIELSDDKDVRRQMQLKTYFFVPFVRPCMHHYYSVISGSRACRDCVWHIISDAELYTTYPGDRGLRRGLKGLEP